MTNRSVAGLHREVFDLDLDLDLGNFRLRQNSGKEVFPLVSSLRATMS